MNTPTYKKSRTVPTDLDILAVHEEKKNTWTNGTTILKSEEMTSHASKSGCKESD